MRGPDREKRKADLRDGHLDLLRKQIETFNRMSKEATVITEFLKGPAWTGILKPLIENRIRRFQEHESWELSNSAHDKARGEAAFARYLREYLLTRDGQADTYLKRAEDASEALERATK